MAASFFEVITTPVPTDLLWACVFDRWTPKAGDPSVMGWLTVFYYLLTAGMALRVATGGAFNMRTRKLERRFWLCLCVLMLFLAVNKQLDLQSFFTATGRCTAKIQGWYKVRRIVQQGFIVGLAGTMSLFGLWMIYTLRCTLRRTWLAVLGMLFVLGFVLIRAVGFHDVDSIINYTVGSVRMNWVLELLGLIFIFVNAMLHPRAANVRRHNRSVRRQAKRRAGHSQEPD
ncbi:MAG: isopropylmalate isomerase [Litoreibacter sp.]